MGALCCCPCIEDYDEHQHPGNMIHRNCLCLRYFFHQLFTGFEALFQRLEGHSSTSSIQEETPLTTDLGTTSSGTSSTTTYQLVPRPAPYDTDPRYSRSQREGLVLRREKSLNHLQEKMQVLRRNGSSSGTEHLGYGKKRNAAESEECKGGYSETEKALGMKLSYSLNYGTISSEDEDVCPTCLEEYTADNPKIVAQCSHHFHLGCIYEWMERSNYCPICGKEMEFCESP